MNNKIFTINIEKETLANIFFRKVLFTTKYQQLVIMNIKPKEDIPFDDMLQPCPCSR